MNKDIILYMLKDVILKLIIKIMFKKKLLLIVLPILLLTWSLNIFAQNNSQEKYSKVKIYATTSFDFNRMAQSGLHLDGGIYKPGLYF